MIIVNLQFYLSLDCKLGDYNDIEIDTVLFLICIQAYVEIRITERT